MSDSTAGKAAAAGKVAWGVVKAAGAVAAFTGHGLLGGFLRSHSMMAQAKVIGKRQFDSALKTLNEGMRELEK